MKQYQTLQDLTTQFIAFNISSIPRNQNTSTDLLANVASKLLPAEDCSPNRFSVKLIFRPSVLDNITNWRLFYHDQDILNFLTSDKSYDEQIIDEDDHDLQITLRNNENLIPKSVFKLENLYDIKDRFRKVTNAKLQSSTLNFKLVNLGSDSKP